MLLNFERCKDKIEVKIGFPSVSFTYPEESVWAVQCNSFRSPSFYSSIDSPKDSCPNGYIYSFLLRLSGFFSLHKVIM